MSAMTVEEWVEEHTGSTSMDVTEAAEYILCSVESNSKLWKAADDYLNKLSAFEEELNYCGFEFG